MYVVITRQSNPPISKFSRTCNEFTNVWSMFPYNTNISTANYCETSIHHNEQVLRKYITNTVSMHTL